MRITGLEHGRNNLSKCRETVECPTCMANEPCHVGQLRDNLSFAGKLLEKPIPGGNLYHCKNCSIGFRSPILDESEYIKLYDNKSYEQWTSGPERTDQQLILDRLTHGLAATARILDVGCNTGELLVSAPTSLLKFGVEINSTAGSIAASKGITVYQSLYEIPESEKFDAIILCDVIEHVANPASLILDLCSRLSRDGEILISTGDFENPTWTRFGANWWYCSYAEHIRFISESWAKRFCASNQIRFEIISRFRYTRLGFFHYVRDFLLMTMFGLFPKIYLGIGKLLKSMLGRDGDFPVKGIGIVKDHILLSLRPANED